MRFLSVAVVWLANGFKFTHLMARLTNSYDFIGNSLSNNVKYNKKKTIALFIVSKLNNTLTGEASLSDFSYIDDCRTIESYNKHIRFLNNASHCTKITNSYFYFHKPFLFNCSYHRR